MSNSETLWTVACQVPLSVGFSRQEYWSELSWPPPGDLPDSGTEPASLMSPALAGRFFTTSATWEAPHIWYYILVIWNFNQKIWTKNSLYWKNLHFKMYFNNTSFYERKKCLFTLELVIWPFILHQHITIYDF